MIQLLSNDTIQKIAAGEVIERPSSIVKELVENSIDAGSTRVIVEIKNGGIDLIEVVDNGSGIKEEEIEMAFQRHATSKLNDFSDLYNLDSLGFRGEALASIVSVSKVTVSTKTKDNRLGKKVEFEDGKVVSEKPIGKNTGTSISVRDLFYNIPVRKKFLKNPITEANNITNLMYKLAIGNFNIGITYIKDDKLIFETKENEDLISNISELFGIDLMENLLNINFKTREYEISGYISNNKYYRANRSLQYIYINNRYIENKEIRDSIESSYRSIIPNGRFPIFQLFINIKPQHLDVNIHPNKEKVQITILNDILEDLSDIVAEALYNNINLPSIDYKEENNDGNILFEQKSDIKNLLEKFDNKVDEKKDILNISERPKLNFIENDNHSEEDKENIYFENELIKEENRENYYSINIESEPELEIKIESKDFLDEEYDETIEEFNFIDLNDKDLFKYIGIIFKTYIIYEDLQNEKIYIIDQHAAHERILYEKFMEKFKNNDIVIQSLLIPITVELLNDEMEIYNDNKEVFGKIGFDIDIFGDNTLIIRKVPNILGIPKEKRFFLDILDSLKSLDRDLGYDSIYEKIIRNSCKYAVKSGDELGDIEVTGLLDQLMKCDNPYTCPHGRPTLIEMTKYEMEKNFMRVK